MKKLSEKDRIELRKLLNSPKWIELIEERQKTSEHISEYIRNMSVVPPEILNQPMTI